MERVEVSAFRAGYQVAAVLRYAQFGIVAATAVKLELVIETSSGVSDLKKSWLWNEHLKHLAGVYSNGYNYVPCEVIIKSAFLPLFSMACNHSVAVQAPICVPLLDKLVVSSGRNGDK